MFDAFACERMMVNGVDLRVRLRSILEAPKRQRTPRICERTMARDIVELMSELGHERFTVVPIGEAVAHTRAEYAER